jgi:hypothetical protein
MDRDSRRSQVDFTGTAGAICLIVVAGSTPPAATPRWPKGASKKSAWYWGLSLLPWCGWLLLVKPASEFVTDGAENAKMPGIKVLSVQDLGLNRSVAGWKISAKILFLSVAKIHRRGK